MKIAIMAGLLAKRYVKIYTAQVVNPEFTYSFEIGMVSSIKTIFCCIIKILIAIKVCCYSFISISCAQNYSLKISAVDKDSYVNIQGLLLQTRFQDQRSCTQYIKKLPSILFDKGYPSASIDSVVYKDSAAILYLYLGKSFKGVVLKQDSISDILFSSNGIRKSQSKSIWSFQELNKLEERLINYYMDIGYPFVSLKLDSIKLFDSVFSASLKINTGTLYHIDSIRQYGKLKISNSFLQNYLNIHSGSIYSLQKFKEINKKITQLSYVRSVQNPDFSMLGTGAVLNLYLDAQKSNQINALIGIIPAVDANSKARLTGDVNLALTNTLKSGETILFNWQQLQKQSPKLNIGYIQPYIFSSVFGVDFNFNLFKKDSSYIKVNAQLGVIYELSNDRSLRLFLQAERSYLLSGGYDTNQIRNSKILPINIDYSSSNVGINYLYNTTDYKLNPRKGSDITLTTSAGIKKITSNNDIINLKDPNQVGFDFHSLYDSLKQDNYLFHLGVSAIHYFPTGKRAVLKTAVNLALIKSPYLFKNELYVLGGYRLLRGFDEESIYANQYAIFTAEYRYLTGRNSFLYSFSDVGFTGTHYQLSNYSNTYISIGLGVSFETKAGLLNLSYAIGKRNDIVFNLSEASKIHFGFINFF